MIIKVILLMGGEGHRFGSEIPKQFLTLSGKAVYRYALELFLSFPEIEEVIVVAHKKWVAYVEKEVGGERVTLIEGGETRKHSSYCGLLACGSHTDAVIIHDAVRPLVSREIVRGHIDALSRYRAINTCIPSTDAVVYSAHPGSVDNIPDRSFYWRGQTPQSFAYPLILEAHRKAKIPAVYDDCSLVLALGHPVHLLPGSEDNIKITFLTDLFLAEQFLRLRSQSSLESERSLEGKIFAITGGTGGIGAAIARSLDREGAISLIISQSSQEYSVDLTRCEEAQRVFQEIFSHHGWLDGLINCTGLLRIKPFHQLQFHEINELISSNLFSVLYSCRVAQIKPGGHIINFSSSSFSRGRKSYVLYSSTKAAILNFTQGLAEERPDLRVNAIIPQRTNTSMRRSNFPGEDPSTLLFPEEVADGVLSLLKDGKMTGSFIEVRKK